MFWEQTVEFASLSDVGFRRQNNQDSLAVQLCENREEWLRRGHLFVVADGMGGHAVGELASKITTDVLPHTFFKLPSDPTPDAIKIAIETANASVNERGSQNKDFDQMGTTCSALTLSPAGAIIGQVGDSRVYRIRGDVVDQLSFDHSLQWELIRQGHLSPDEVYASQPKNIITRSLGPEPTVTPDIEGPHPIEGGDVYLLCSDGLTGHVTDPELGAIAATLPPGDACQLLVNLANLRGGTDNITVVIARVGHAPEGVVYQAPTEPEDDDHDGFLSWPQLLISWLLAAGFLVGICLAMLTDATTIGAGLTAVTFVTELVLLYFWLRNRPPARERVQGNRGEPYRTAEAKLTPEMQELIAGVHQEMWETAQRERWKIREDAYGKAKKELQRAESHNRPAEVFRRQARCIQVLMSSLKAYRKRSAATRQATTAPPDETSVFDD